MRRTLIPLLFSVISLTCFAQTVSESEALLRASRFLQKNSARAKSNKNYSSELTLAYTSQQENNTHFYIFNKPDNQGFIIIGGDEQAREILGNSDSGSFSVETAPPALIWWLSQYDAQISAAIKYAKENPAAAKSVKSEKAVAAAPRASIDYMCKTMWGQTNPYNLAITKEGGNYYTGCVATAAAQVMKFLSYPSSGVDHVFAEYALSDSYTAREINSNMTFEWDKMTNQYGRWDEYSDPAAKAVADLMYCVGRAAGMSYGTGNVGSGTTAQKLGYGMTSYLKFDKTMKNECRALYSDEDWEDLVYSELSLNCPVVYFGSSATEGGHCFICDGYDETEGGYHINWGWEGGLDGYFPLTGADALKAYKYVDNSNFTQSQEILCNIKPDEGGQYEYHLLTNSKMTLDKTEAEKGTSLYLSTTVFLRGVSAFSVRYGVCLVDETTNKEIFVPSESGAFDYKLGSYYMPSVPFKVPMSVTLGTTYKVYLAFQANGGDWQRADTPLDASIPTLKIKTPANPLYLSSDPVLAGDNQGYMIPDDFGITFNIRNQTSEDITNDIQVTYYSPYYMPSYTYYYSKGQSYLSNITFKANSTKELSVGINDVTSSSFVAGKDLTFALYNASKGYYLMDKGSVYFYLRAPQTISYTLSSAEWGTICLPFSAEVPNGITAYEVTGVSGTQLQLKIAEKMKMNTPYLLNGTPDTYSFIGPTTPEQETCTGGLLVGNTTAEQTYAPMNSYVLQKKDGALGFYKVAEEGKQRCKQYSAYLSLPATVAANACLSFDKLPEATGIIACEAERPRSSKAFNLQGQQVDPKTKGIVIINGKKHYNK